MARLMMTTAYMTNDQKWRLMSAKPDPFSNTIRMMRMKYITGFSLSSVCAHGGMLSIEVNRPLIRIKTTMKKNETSMACCCVLVMVEISRPKDKITKR